MGPIAVSIVTAAAPYVVKGLFSWGSNAVKTWGPSYAARAAIEGSAAAGKQLAGGGNGWLGAVGSAAGRVFGWGAAPFVAQSDPVQSGIGFTAGLLTPEVLTEGIKGVAGVTTAYLQSRNGGDQQVQHSPGQDVAGGGTRFDDALYADKLLKYKMKNKLLKDQIKLTTRMEQTKKSPFI